MKWYAAVLPALLLAACSTTDKHPPPPAESPENQAPHLKPEQIHTDLIRQMLSNGQYYAALAHIEEQKRSSGDSDELTLLEADARGHLGPTEHAHAEALYRKLLSSHLYAAQAYHGLGRLYVSTNLEEAIRNLGYAVERAPTEVDFRNDLGYALMEDGRYTEAQPQLSTAAELAPTQPTSRNNLIILMILWGKEDMVQQLAQRTSPPVTPERLKELRATAQSIREKQIARAAKPAG
jgi:tetratricopeptide (TPR) repeat protein